MSSVELQHKIFESQAYKGGEVFDSCHAARIMSVKGAYYKSEQARVVLRYMIGQGTIRKVEGGYCRNHITNLQCLSLVVGEHNAIPLGRFYPCTRDVA